MCRFHVAQRWEGAFHSMAHIFKSMRYFVNSFYKRPCPLTDQKFHVIIHIVIYQRQIGFYNILFIAENHENNQGDTRNSNLFLINRCLLIMSPAWTPYMFPENGYGIYREELYTLEHQRQQYSRVRIEILIYIYAYYLKLGRTVNIRWNLSKQRALLILYY